MNIAPRTHAYECVIYANKSQTKPSHKTFAKRCKPFPIIGDNTRQQSSMFSGHLPVSGVVDGDTVEQASNPSFHVCSNFAFPGVPHLPCQDPPLPQQLSCPLLPIPHSAHPEQQIVFTLIKSNKTAPQNIRKKIQTVFHHW